MVIECILLFCCVVEFKKREINYQLEEKMKSSIKAMIPWSKSAVGGDKGCILGFLFADI